MKLYHVLRSQGLLMEEVLLSIFAGVIYNVFCQLMDSHWVSPPLLRR